MGLYDFTFYDLICRNAESFGKKRAWLEEADNKSITFSKYKEKVDSFAQGLRQAKVKKGDRIAVIGKNSLEFFIIYGAAAALGAIVVPINWRLSGDEILYNLTDCEPVILFADKEFEKTIEEIKERLAFIKRYFNLSDSGNFESFNRLFNDQKLDSEDISNDDGFVIIHTAAVHGKPRGALLSHGNVILANIHWNYRFNLSENDIHLNLLPMFHVAGLFMATNTFHAGALNVNMKKFDAQRAVDLIEDKQISFFFDFSPILSSILEAGEKSGKKMKSLRAVAGIDTPETIEKYQNYTNGTFYCIYGQTETSCIATFGPYNKRPGSAGKTIQMARVKLVDDYDRPVPTGSTGEIVMKGPMVFKGYWNMSKDTEYTFRGGWHHTGDLGRFDKERYLFYQGRKAEKELIKPGGENVYPAEVEKVILENPNVEETVVFGVPDPKWKEGIKAVCVLKPGAVLSEKELIDFVGKRIASFKKPKYVEFDSNLPKKEDGSVDREKVKKLYSR